MNESQKKTLEALKLHEKSGLQKNAEFNLKPCPFCGGKAEVSRPDEEHWHVICMNCPCSVGRFWYWKKKDAIKAWNTRLV